MTHAIAFVRTILFVLIFYPGSFLCSFSGWIFTFVSRPAVIAISRFWGRFHYWCCRWLLGQRVRIIGDMPQGAHFYCIKHEAMFEAIDVLRLFDHAAPIAKESLGELPFWGRVARTYGLVPIAREAGASALRVMLKTARQAQADGRALVLFPEGSRIPHGESPALKSGMAGIYSLLKMPIIPVAIDSGRLWPRKGFIRYSGTITYKVGETIPAGLSREAVEARVHAAINALNH